MSKINDIQMLNMNFLGALNDMEKVASEIRNAISDPAQRDLLNVAETQKTIDRLHGETLENNKKLADILDRSE